ncbi:MAG: hypothetical protein EAZ55_03290 [Cytophagales bacterium]|nr:MAG: hypothetical protein EAZ55_03290 [Cytophagales bacterium]
MHLVEVKDTASEKLFLSMPLAIYKEDKNWVRPLDNEIKTIFNPAKNPKFEGGEAIRWLLMNNQNECIGRVAAFYNQKISDKEKQPTGGIGFFECIDNQEAANVLLEACKNWLTQKGMQAMDGIVNFGERNSFWGLLIEGDLPQSYGANYHPKYYKKLLENYGFQEYFKQFTYRVSSKHRPEEDFEKRAERILSNQSYQIRHIEMKHLHKYLEDFREIYNKSWVKHAGVPEMTTKDVEKMAKDLKPIIDEKLIWFCYYNGEPIAFMVMIPEINQIIRKLNGKMHLWNQLRFLYYQKMKTINVALGLVIGIAPRFQGRGVDSAMMKAFSKESYQEKFQYHTLEFNWVGDFLPAMMSIYENIGAKVVKIHATYRYLFDRTIPFERHPIIK